MASVKTVNSSRLRGVEVLSAGKWLKNRPEKDQSKIQLDIAFDVCKL
jgi:hypothetical protein